ncbi:hypothetical protein QE152_g1771 [Popillia japonica]|uniref:Uncharacterized protein n=1 Tax=Popillia japonica TaxID=7064 RepID=A0AAW1N546_POPJA
MLVIIHQSVHNTYRKSGLKSSSLPSINLPGELFLNRKQYLLMQIFIVIFLILAGFHEEPTEENSVLRFGSRFNMERSVLISRRFCLSCSSYNGYFLFYGL